MNKKRILLFQVLLIAISWGCMSGPLVARPSPAVAIPDQPPSDFAEWEAGNIQKIQLNSGQEILSNYREQFRIEFTGKEAAGAPFDAFQEYLVEVDRSQAARREVETIQSPDPYLNGSHEMVFTPDDTYTVTNRIDGPVCQKLSTQTDSAQITAHLDIIQAIAPGKLIKQQVEWNGILADVYDIQDVQLMLKNNLKKVSGKVWIAHDVHYFLKAEGTLEGEFWFEDLVASGSAVFSYEVKDLGQVQIQPPALCTHPTVDLIPLPADATEVNQSDFSVSFSSPQTLDQLKLFFANELTARGWKVEMLSADAYPKALTATTTTVQNLEVYAEIQINAMSEGSFAVITWQLQ